MAGDLASLDSLVDDILDRRGVTPTKLGSEFRDSGHRVISAKLMKDHRLDLSADEPRYVDEGTYRRWMATPILADDVLLTSEAPLGEVAYVERDVDWCLGQRLFCIRTDKRRLHGRYLFYCLRGDPSRSDLLTRATGTTVQGIRQSELRRVGIPVRPLPEQKRIAHILGALDDKIDLNRRMNATLEAMSRAIFKSWFVDFDPVRQKAAGKQPVGMDAQTAALFPDSFEDAEIGEVPKGWAVDAIKNRASNIQYGFTQSATKEPVGPRFLRITDISGGGLDWGDVPFCQATDAEREKYRIVDGDILVARTGASTGENVYAVEPPPAVFASYLVRIQFMSRGIGRLVGEFMRSPDYAGYVSGMIGGSAQPNASAQTLAAAPMVFPTEEVAIVFYQAMRPRDLLRATNDRQSRTLAALRDTLLPKLLSGEVRVPEAEGIVEEAVE
jgi:type I restriction enzyme S subunit